MQVFHFSNSYHPGYNLHCGSVCVSLQRVQVEPRLWISTRLWLVKWNPWPVMVELPNIFAFAPSLEDRKEARKTKALPSWGPSSSEHKQPLWRVWAMEGFSWIPCHSWNTTNMLVIFIWQGYVKKRKYIEKHLEGSNTHHWWESCNWMLTYESGAPAQKSCV